MAPAKKILIADPDLESVRGLTRALRQKGYQVHYAPDGSRALEVAVLRHPDLTLFDENCKLLEAKTFINILKTNPRTEDIPVVLTTESLDSDRVRGLRDGYLKKPFNLDEVLSRIDHIFRRSEAAKDLKGESKEIEGNLQQLAIPDLLQILAMNKRTGRLTLTRGSDRGEIHVAEGKPVNAKTSNVEGDKAMFRLLTWTEGSFAFMPGPPPGRARIQRAMEDALMEGMRQADEVARLLPSLPPRNARVHLAPETDLPKDQHPVTAEVVELLRQPRAVADVIDLATATDLDVMTVLSTLMQKGVVRIAEGDAQLEGSGPLLGPAEIHALRARMFRGRPPSRAAVAKVFVCGAPAMVRQFMTRLPGLTPIAAQPDALRSQFGTLGRYDVGEALKVDFCVLPGAEAAKPLWRPFAAGAVGALVLDDHDAALKMATFLAREARLPIVVVGRPVPEALEHAPAGAAAVGQDLTEALRSLLVQSLNPVQPEGQSG
ncbi:MAG: DUF4388 domain-containing protein [Myxococcaceae bacterium]